MLAGNDGFSLKVRLLEGKTVADCLGSKVGFVRIADIQPAPNAAPRTNSSFKEGGLLNFAKPERQLRDEPVDQIKLDRTDRRDAATQICFD